ncbi:MAG: hypothetical protein GX640_06380 [Fibrobacter sp.]|nr:hypothetical protein [Fibrobacter sp.]
MGFNSKATAFLLLLLLGCSAPVSQSGGGDDFPNSIIGIRIAENLSIPLGNPTTSSFDEFLTINPGFDITTHLPGLGKYSARPCDTITLSQNESNDWVLTRRKCTDSSVVFDTAVFRLNGQDTVLLRNSGKDTSLLKTTYYRYFDLDGDSVLFNPSSKINRVMGRFETRHLLGRTDILVLGIDGGNDGNFNTVSDNKVIKGEYSQLYMGDTLLCYSLSDADNDGYILNKAVSDSQLVGVSVFWKLSVISRKSATVTMVTFPGDGLKDYLISYSSEETVVGRTVKCWVRGRSGTLFYPSDTVRIYRVTLPLLPGDSLQCDTTIITIKLGGTPHDSLDDKLIGLYTHSVVNRLMDTECKFEFRSAVPLTYGSAIKSGTFDMELLYKGKGWFEIVGNITETEIDAVVRFGDESSHARWGRDGVVIGKN